MVIQIYLICLLLFNSGFSRNLPRHESFEIRYGPYREYKWRNSSTTHVGIYNQNLFCCGTLLTLSHALTTAGCFVPFFNDVTKMLVYGGTMSYYHHDPRAQVRAVKQVVTHENYSIFGPPENDIAILVVAAPFVETFRISTARLPNRLWFNKNVYTSVYELSVRDEHAGTFASIEMNGFRFKGDESYKCGSCDSEFLNGDYYDANGTVIAKLMCYMGHSNRWAVAKLIHTCYGGLGCPLMSYDNEILTMHSIYYPNNCSRYARSPEIFQRSTICQVGYEVRAIQVFFYVDWIRANLKLKKVIQFRPYRIHNKKINLKPHIPLLVYITLIAIAIIVFLICNRAVFGRVRL